MDFSHQIGKYLIDKFELDSNLEVKIHRFITTGWETEIYCFSVENTKNLIFPKKTLVLRLYPHFNSSNRAMKEFEIIKWLNSQNFPVPEVYLLETGKNPLNRPFIIMEEIQGVTLREHLKHVDKDESNQLIRKFSSIFHKLHNLNINSFPKQIPEVPQLSTSTFLNVYFDSMSKMLKMPNFHFLLPILDWIRNHSDKVTIEKISIIHGDYHPDNILVDQKGSFYIIDWSASLLADYRYDLAWSMLLMFLYSGEEFKNQIYDDYNKILNDKINHIDIFVVIAILRRLTDLSRVLTLNPEETGIREETSDVIKDQIKLVNKIYTLLYELTGIELDIDVLGAT